MITLGKALVRREPRPWLFSHQLAKPAEIEEVNPVRKQTNEKIIRLDGDTNVTIEVQYLVDS